MSVQYLMVPVTLLLLASSLLQSSALKQCEQAWTNGGKVGRYQKYFAAMCRGDSPSDQDLCPGDHPAECCMHEDCDRGTRFAGMKCGCHSGCQRLACQYELDRKCDYVTHPRNGEVKRLTDTRVQVACDTGFIAYPPDTFDRHCNPQQSKEWLPKIECRRKCKTPPGFAFSNRLTKGSSFAVGQTVQYSCKPGYVFLDGKDHVTCQERDGRAQWTRITCQILKCPKIRSSDPNLLAKPASADFYRSVVRFSCPAGFDLIGTRQVRCDLASATTVAWSGSPPTCREKRCPMGVVSSTSDPYAKLKNDTGRNFANSGESVSFSCPAPSMLRDSGTLQCYRGSWSSGQPKCKPSCCERRGIPVDAGQDVTYSDPHKLCPVSEVSRAFIQCNTCHLPASRSNVTSLRITCDNGTWPDSSSLVCERKTCPPLQSLLGATPSHQMPDIESSAGNLTTLPQPCGASVRLSCSDSSRKLVPPVPVVHCTSSGEWSVKNLGICLLKNAASCSQAIPGVDETRFDVRIPADRSAGVRVSISNCRARCMRTPAVTAVCMLDHTIGELNWQLDGVPNCTVSRCSDYKLWSGDRYTHLGRKSSNSCLGGAKKVRCRQGYYRLVRNNRRAVVRASCSVQGEWTHSPYNMRCIANCSNVCTGTGEECYVSRTSPKEYSCRCIANCPKPTQASDALCGSDGKTYDTRCHLQQQICKTGQHIGELPLEECNKGGRCWTRPPISEFSKYANPVANCRRKIGDYFNFRNGQCQSYEAFACQRLQENTFQTSRQCYRECIEERVCHMAPDKGPCNGTQQRHFFNCSSSRCERFTYGGCGGNQNNFRTRLSCEGVATGQQCKDSNNTCNANNRCCESEQVRRSTMCNDADFAITARVQFHSEPPQNNAMIYTARVTGIVHGERILARNEDGAAVELVAGLTRYTLVVNKAPSGCGQCTVIPTSGNMFLMGRIAHSEAGTPFLHMDQSAFGFAYRLTSDGRDEVCSFCPAASAVSTSARCPVPDQD
eukprot:scpid16057/ scgid31134/ C4b-binding protein alpha chain